MLWIKCLIVILTKADWKIEVLDVYRSGGDHDVHQTCDSVDSVKKHVENVHPGS